MSLGSDIFLAVIGGAIIGVSLTLYIHWRIKKRIIRKMPSDMNDIIDLEKQTRKEVNNERIKRDEEREKSLQGKVSGAEGEASRSDSDIEGVQDERDNLQPVIDERVDIPKAKQTRTKSSRLKRLIRKSRRR